MTIHYVKPVINYTVRSLCFKPYPNHPKGCPNFGKRDICPPQAPPISSFFDLDKKIMAVVIHFSLELHRQKMLAEHPNWSKRQTDCCLYWQGTVRKQLKQEIAYNLTRANLFDGGELIATDCPEAMGVDVTATMKKVGIILEWPPEKIVRKIAFIGTQL
jgi:predicted metal-binding protein